MKTKTAILLFLVTCSGSLFAEEISTIIDDIDIYNDIDSDTQMIPENISIESPDVGVNARKIDSPKNRFGIKLDNLEKVEDISLSRRNFNWINKKSKNIVNTSLGNKQKYRAKVQHQIFNKTHVTIDSEIFNDNSKYKYLDNGGTPYTPEDDYKNFYKLNKTTKFVGVKISRNPFTLLYEYDQKVKNEMAGVSRVGTIRSKRNEVDFNYSNDLLSSTVYFSNHIQDFKTHFYAIKHSQTKGNKIVLSNDVNLPSFTNLTVSFKNEKYIRNIKDQSPESFKRNEIEIIAQKNFLELNHIEIKINAELSYIYDKSTTRTRRLVTNPNIYTNDKYKLLNTGLDISTLPVNLIGLRARARYFELENDPSHKFGNGGLLTSNLDLENEKGKRISIGPWLKSKYIDAELSYFAEDSKNYPIMVASPSNVKMLSLGGVWTRGFKLIGKLKINNNFEIKNNYIYQKAINASNISYQKGYYVPNRPLHNVITSIILKKSDFKFEASYNYKSDEYQDLIENLKLKSNFTIDASIQYQLEKLAVRIESKNLFMSRHLKKAPKFSSSAGVNLLDYTVPQQSVALITEFSI